MADNDSDAYHEIDVVFVRETKDAILILTEDDDELWLPKSQIHVDRTGLRAGDKFSLEVKMWLARRHGLI